MRDYHYFKSLYTEEYPTTSILRDLTTPVTEAKPGDFLALGLPLICSGSDIAFDRTHPHPEILMMRTDHLGTAKGSELSLNQSSRLTAWMLSAADDPAFSSATRVMCHALRQRHAQERPRQDLETLYVIAWHFPTMIICDAWNFRTQDFIIGLDFEQRMADDEIYRSRENFLALYEAARTSGCLQPEILSRDRILL